jgi:molybdopterin-guanine dinucleotide biosynthesis protein B
MRDLGLEAAIRAAGGVTELARRIGLSQPSVSNWSRVPAERVLQVEAVTKVGRSVLRPDLYGERTDRAADAMRIIGLAGWSGSGKTTLLAKLIPALIARGKKLSTLKHAHHGFDLDQPGKDSYVHRAAGASEVLIASAKRWALMSELRDRPEPLLRELLTHLSPVDLVMVEGFKREKFPKIEVHRAAVGKPLLHGDDDWIVAIASDEPVPQASVPVIDLNDVEKIADVMLAEAMPLDRLDAIEQDH